MFSQEQTEQVMMTTPKNWGFIKSGGKFIQTTLCCILLFFCACILLKPTENLWTALLRQHPCKFNIARPYTSQPVQFFPISTLTSRLRGVNFSFRPTLSSEQSLKTLCQDWEEIHSLNEKILRFLIQLPLTSLSLEHFVRKVSELQTFPKQWQLRMRDLYSQLWKYSIFLKNFFISNKHLFLTFYNESQSWIMQYII